MVPASRTLAAILQRLAYCSGGNLDPAVERDARAAPPEIVEEAISALPVAAAAVPVSTVLDARSFFLPMSSLDLAWAYRDLLALAFFVGFRRAHTAIAALEAIFTAHASDDARLIAGHALVAIGDPAAIERVTDASRTDSPGRFVLWCAARFAAAAANGGSDGAAFVEIIDRLATRPVGLADTVYLEAALHAAWRAEAHDARWGELALRLLEVQPRHWAGREMAARVGERRALPYIFDELAHPDYNTVLIAVEQVEMLVGRMQAVELLRDRKLGHPDIYADLCRRTLPRREPNGWERLSLERASTSLVSRARRYETDVRAAFALAPPTTSRAAFARWVATQPEASRPALFDLYDGRAPAWTRLLDAYERRAIRRQRL